MKIEVDVEYVETANGVDHRVLILDGERYSVEECNHDDFNKRVVRKSAFSAELGGTPCKRCFREARE